MKDEEPGGEVTCDDAAKVEMLAFHLCAYNEVDTSVSISSNIGKPEISI